MDINPFPPDGILRCHLLILLIKQHYSMEITPHTVSICRCHLMNNIIATFGNILLGCASIASIGVVIAKVSHDFLYSCVRWLLNIFVVNIRWNTLLIMMQCIFVYVFIINNSLICYFIKYDEDNKGLHCSSRQWGYHCRCRQCFGVSVNFHIYNTILLRNTQGTIYNIVLYNSICYYILLYTIIYYCIILYGIVYHYILLYTIV